MSEDFASRRVRSTAKGAAWMLPAIAIGPAAPSPAAADGATNAQEGAGLPPEAGDDGPTARQAAQGDGTGDDPGRASG